jgi:hypothetical protein
MYEIRFSFWGKAMDFTGEPGNQLPFFIYTAPDLQDAMPLFILFPSIKI